MEPPWVLAAVVLAAGAGSRMGGRPKSLLELDGVPLIRRQLMALTSAGVHQVVVVLGHHAELIEPALRPFAVRVVRNPRPDDGPVSSQRLGLRAMKADVDAVMMVLADQPLITAQDLVALTHAYRNRPAGTRVVFPQVAGTPGNPVIFGSDACRHLLEGDEGLGCRQWRQAHPDAVHTFETDNPHYCVDVDTEDDIVRLEQTSGHLLRWPAALARRPAPLSQPK